MQKDKIYIENESWSLKRRKENLPLLLFPLQTNSLFEAIFQRRLDCWTVRKTYTYCQFSRPHFQGDGWIYNQPLWKSTWRRANSALLLADSDRAPGFPPRGSEVREWNRVRRFRDLQGLSHRLRRRIKSARDDGWGTFGHKSIFYIQ